MKYKSDLFNTIQEEPEQVAFAALWSPPSPQPKPGIKAKVTYVMCEQCESNSDVITMSLISASPSG